jgi:methylenetetrahydrofolate dehydrogenase (NADP+)/methenyltetrahydrofolate cyclohydrolase
MIVLGKPLAETILLDLKEQIASHGLMPHLVIILAGDNSASRTYIKYKKIAAERIGVTVTIKEFESDQANHCLDTIKQLNTDSSVHGIIVQLPVFSGWPTEEIVNTVVLHKDVDGFLPNSPYTPATADGVWEMLGEFARLEKYPDTQAFLKDKNIVVLGKGRTAGKPTRNLLLSKGFESHLIDSKTENPDKIISNADVIITATGKKHIIHGDNIKDGAYVIAVGVGKEVIDGEEKLFGDINEHQIREKAALYCPTVGGIGPLTIACLLRNVVIAAENK